MKKITLVVVLTILLSSVSFAQKGSSYEKAMYYLKEKGEVIFTFKASSKAQFLEISRIVSVSHKAVDENELKAEVYANKEQFQKFLTYGLAYEVTAEDNEIPQELTANRAAAAWDTTWDAYPKYSEYVAKMQLWAATYPSLCSLQSIGTTPLGRNLYVLKISDNVATDETEPEFFYTSSMHGDEITGYPTMLHFIDHLLTNYGSLNEITNLINNTELYINPLANPDGSYKTANNDVYNPGGAANTPTRANSNGIDLNRNYADAIGGLHDDNQVYQPETIAFMNFQATRNFVLAANYHGGTEVVNFPLDTSNTPNTGNFSFHPHDSYFKFVSIEYAQLCQTADGNLNYMDAVYNTGQYPGTTNGAAWYSVYGGRQDASNYFDHSKEITVEISDLKTPAAANLPFFWDRNRQALLNFVKQASYGLHGIVTDQSGNPIHAKVYIGGTFDNFGSWVETSPTKGDYHKVQIAGTYNVIFEAPGYATQTISVTLTNNATTTLNVTMVPSTSVPTASDVTICTGQTAALSATGTGTIRWYNSATSTTPLASTAAYTTPALTSNTSYWVEREVTPANVGPATVSGTGATNTALANRYLIFNCTTPTKLKSVAINNTVVGDILVELQNSSGVMLESKVIRLTTTGSKDIDLDFFLPVANGLRLVSRQLSGTSNTLIRATTGITYPITSGNISITGNSGTGTFFQFFNWKLGAVKSNRDQVDVTVKPNPTNASISPTSKIAGSGSFTLTVNGTNFVNGESIVRWNGTNRPTTFVSTTQLSATINNTDIATAGTANVTIFNTCNSTTTAAQTFTITTNCTAPVPNVASLPTVTGQCSATVTAPTATSNCYGTITATTINPTTYNAQGSYVINWTYNDGNGNTSMQQQTVVINDTTAPVANVTNLPSLNGQCAVTVTQTPTATDNCMGTINATTTDPLSYSVQGTYSILWTYTDNRGNQSFQTQTVVVSDTTAPVANVTTLPTVTGQCSATVTAPTATDNCVGQITATTTSPLTYNTQGTFNITWTYNDGNGNTSTQTQTVIVDDTIAPVANVASLPTVTGQCSATVTAPTATDNCIGQITATTTSPLTYNTQGTFNITWTYNDGNGNTSTQTQTVIVDDTVAPVANVTNLPTVTGQCSATVTAPTATDTCAGQITGTTTSPLTYNAHGTYNITWTYNDGNGNTSTQTQTVIVDDTIAPVANVTSLPTVTGQCSASVTAPTATDNCAGTITATTTDALTYNAQGTFNITWTYNDGNGNTSTQTQTVIVDDTIAPVANVTPLPTVNGQCSATVTAPTATDACAGTIIATTLDPLTYNNQGTYNITWTYDDGNGNTSTQTQTVTVANGGNIITFYQDLDGDSFGNANVFIQDCAQPIGYVTDSSDCNDNQIQYADDDNDGFGSTNQVACGVTNNTDCNDNNPTQNVLITFYQDLDGDAFGNPNVSIQDCAQPVGYVLDASDCNDNQLQYNDADGDGFGSNTIVACGVPNNIDCNDTNENQNVLITFYQDLDGDTFGNPSVSIQDCSQPIGYVIDNTDCNDNQIQYEDNDNDGFGSMTQVACGTTNNTDCNDNNPTQNVLITFYQDLDNDTFGNPAVSTLACTQPEGYVLDASDCNDNQIQYADLDADGFGSTTQVACGVTNNTDCNDNLLTYADNDADGFGSTTLAACGVTNNTDCNDNLLTYADNDADGFGSTTLAACGVTNNTDCNDSQLTYADNDADGFGSTTLAACGVANNTDCNDNQLTYVDNDADGFGSTTLTACGVTNNTDCNDNQLTYADNDADGFGSTTLAACGVTNNTDCNDNQLTYADNDADGFGSTTLTACGVTNNTDCNDNQLTYADNDADGFGSTTLAACGVTNSSDCNDNQLTYADNDADGFGSTTLAACGVTNNTDCNDSQLTYADNDADDFGSTTLAACGVTNNTDCNDNQLTYADNDADGFGSTTLAACGVANNTDCNDNQLTYADNDSDGFGSTTLAACGVTNNTDCNDNQLTYADNDADGFGSTTLAACGVTNNTDCDDNNPSQNVLITFYQDLDNDTFGNPAVSTQACSQPIGYVTNNTDCNDTQIQFADSDGDGFGSTTQVACGVTNNTDCNDNNPSQNVLITFYQDLDGDTFGNPAVSTQACSQPFGYVTNNQDCNDNNAASNALNTYYQDLDNDGFGNPNVSLQACAQPVGYVIFGTDCDDTRANVNPNATDVCYDGLDNDCNGIIDNACTPIVTTLTPATCGVTLVGWYSTITAIWSNNAQGYRFRITKIDANTNMPMAQSLVVERPVNNISLANVAGTTYNSRYQIEVAVKFNNVWQPFYGAPCFVDTPNPTSTISSQCGATLTAFNQWVTADAVTVVSQYRFRITEMNANGTAPTGTPAQVITSTSNKFNMTQLTGIFHNTFYKVEVALRNTDGTFLAYGAACNVKTPAHPTTQLLANYCNGYNVVSNTEFIAASPVSNATQYRFRLFNATGYDTTFTTAANKFNFNNFPGITSGTYSVQVSVKLPNELNFGPYGSTCSIIKQGTSSRTVTEDSLDEVAFEVAVYPNPFTNNFNIKTNAIFNKNTSITVYDLTGRQIEKINLEANDLENVAIGASYPSGVYSMIVTQGNNTKMIRIIKR